MEFEGRIVCAILCGTVGAPRCKRVTFFRVLRALPRSSSSTTGSSIAVSFYTHTSILPSTNPWTSVNHLYRAFVMISQLIFSVRFLHTESEHQLLASHESPRLSARFVFRFPSFFASFSESNTSHSPTPLRSKLAHPPVLLIR